MAAFAASSFLFLALVTGAVAVFGSGRLWRSASDDRIRGLRAAHPDDETSEGGTAQLKRGYSSIPILGHLLGGSSWAESVSLQLQQANIQLRVGEYLLLRVLLGLVLLFLTIFVARLHPVGIVIGLGLSAIGFMLPAFYVRSVRGRRIKKIEEQLVEFAPMLASSLRSGFALQQGIDLAARQLDPPLADELKLFINDANLGATTEKAFLDMGKRVGSTDLDMMITAILVQRSSGGNLSEILDQAAETLRERERIRGDLNTLTAQQRLTGMVLAVYPIAIGLLLLLMMPSVWSVMFTDGIGRVALGVALGLQLTGFLVMRRIMNIDI